MPWLPFTPAAPCSSFAASSPDIARTWSMCTTHSPMISPWVVRVAANAKVPVVQTVHNYRHNCVRGTYFRDGALCEDCRGRSPWPAVLHACYRGSRAESAAMALALVAHRSTWLRVDRFLAVSAFVGEHLVAAGIPRERVSVKANVVPDPGIPHPPGRTVLFAARLDREKGALLLLEAWRLSRPQGYRLVIAGDGEDAAEVASAASSMDDVEYVGAVGRERMQSLMRDAGVVAVPSLWYEGAPMSIVEAWSHGRPVIASAIGSLSAMVDDRTGWLAEPTAEGFARVLGSLDPASIASRGVSARAAYQQTSTPAAVLRDLLAAYEAVQAPDKDTVGNVGRP